MTDDRPTTLAANVAGLKPRLVIAMGLVGILIVWTTFCQGWAQLSDQQRDIDEAIAIGWAGHAYARQLVDDARDLETLADDPDDRMARERLVQGDDRRDMIRGTFIRIAQSNLDDMAALQMCDSLIAQARHAILNGQPPPPSVRGLSHTAMKVERQVVDRFGDRRIQILNEQTGRAGLMIFLAGAGGILLAGLLAVGLLIVQRAYRISIAAIESQAKELHDTNAALTEANRNAIAASRAKSTFLANMSHEIRTPMTAILGYTDLLSDPACDDEMRRAHVTTIRRNGHHLLALINDILDLSKIEAGRMTVEDMDTSLVGVLAEVRALMNVRAVEKGIDLDVAYLTRVPRVIRSDPVRLRQVLMNLVGNAVKFTAQGSVRIEVSTAADAGSVTVAVRDTGIGISEEAISQLFLPFSQADVSTTRRFGGTGLGLTITHRLLDVLGGSIDVESQPDVGSVFSISLPLGADVELVEAAQLTGAAAEPEVNVSAGHGGLEGRRILLAEDGPDNQRLISFHLKRAGAEVVIAENGQVALDVALRAEADGTAFDLVIMDMQMPEMDGYTATRELRRRGFPRPILALTAHAMAGDREKCLMVGCNEYGTKPIDTPAFLSACQRLIYDRISLAS